MELFTKNLERLRIKYPALADQMSKPAEGAELPISYSKSGHPVLNISGIYLHSSYDPISEAKKFIDSYDLSTCQGVIVLGLGLAYHVRELIRRTDVPIVVIEKSGEMLRTALKTVDLEDIFNRAELLVGEDPREIARRKTFQDAFSKRYIVMAHPPSLRYGGGYYGQLVSEFEKSQPRKNKGKLRVLVVSPLYGGSLPIARYVARALKNIGCSVELVDNSAFYHAFSMLENEIKDINGKKKLTEYFLHFLSLYAYQKSREFQPDLVFALAQAPLDDDVLRMFQADKIRTAFWFVENYKVLTYWRDTAWKYDYYFTIQRGEFLEKLKAVGVPNAYYLPLGCDPEIHRPLELTATETDQYGCDLSFAGMGYYNRQLTFRGLLDFKNFKIWGTGWPARHFAGIVQNEGSRFDEQEMVKIFNGSKINLNLHSSTYTAHIEPGGDFVNPRTFELASCGAFQLLDERAYLNEVFAVGEEVVCFKDLHDLRGKIRYYLDHPDERKQIAAKAQARAVRMHTYDLRMKEMLAAVFSEEMLEEMEKENNLNSVERLLGQMDENHDLFPILKAYPRDTRLTLDRLITDQFKAQKYQTDPELVLCLMNDLIAAGKKR